MQLPLPRCSGFGWSRVKFLHWLEWGCVLDLCCEHKCWYFRDVLVTAGQSLHRVKAFCASCTTPPVRSLQLQKKLGGDTAERADPKWPWGTSPLLPNLISWLPSMYPPPFSQSPQGFQLSIASPPTGSFWSNKQRMKSRTEKLTGYFAVLVDNASRESRAGEAAVILWHSGWIPPEFLSAFQSGT